MTNPIRRSLLGSVAAVALMLSACGGGSSSNDLSSKALYTAYEAVAEGMTLVQLTAVVGAEPSGAQADANNGNPITIYTWVGDKNSYLESRLLVNVQAGRGVVGKTVTGPTGSKTESYL